nr:hypothetical protein GCM10025732_03990 [Glycomyces mayteni]
MVKRLRIDLIRTRRCGNLDLPHGPFAADGVDRGVDVLVGGVECLLYIGEFLVELVDELIKFFADISFSADWML